MSYVPFTIVSGPPPGQSEPDRRLWLHDSRNTQPSESPGNEEHFRDFCVRRVTRAFTAKVGHALDVWTSGLLDVWLNIPFIIIYEPRTKFESSRKPGRSSLATSLEQIGDAPSPNLSYEWAAIRSLSGTYRIMHYGILDCMLVSSDGRSPWS